MGKNKTFKVRRNKRRNQGHKKLRGGNNNLNNNTTSLLGNPTDNTPQTGNTQSGNTMPVSTPPVTTELGNEGWFQGKLKGLKNKFSELNQKFKENNEQAKSDAQGFFSKFKFWGGSRRTLRRHKKICEKSKKRRNAGKRTCRCKH